MLSFKQFIDSKPSIIEEGGLYGHMDHLYDNRDLTFSKLKEILKAASEGKLEGIEKTDGQNIFLTYDIPTGTVRAARNKGDIKNGGATAETFATRYKDLAHIKDAFIDALNIFQKAVRGLSLEKQRQIFGDNGNVYYSAEVLDPRTPNVINYDKKSLVIHKYGHAYFNKDTGEVDDNYNIEANVNALYTALTQMQNAVSQDKHSIIRAAVMRLNRISDKSILNNTLRQIEDLQNRYGVSDNQTIRKYIENYMAQLVKPLGLTPPQQMTLINKMSGDKGININTLTKTFTPEQKAQAKSLASQGDKLLKQAIYPLESVIHDFVVEVLKGVESKYLLDNKKELKRLQKSVEIAISKIEASDNESAHEILKQQLKKLKSAENVTSTAEGLAFDYDGHVYKFTGNFAPINQILGIFKYGRIAESFDKLTYDVLSEKTREINVGVYPGSFTPPHIGHFNIAKQMIIDGNDYVIILASQKERQGMSGEATEKIWRDYYMPLLKEKNISLIFSPISPVKDMADLILITNDNVDLKNVNLEIMKLGSKLSKSNNFVNFNIYTGENKYDSFKTNPKYTTHKTKCVIIPTTRPFIDLGSTPLMVKQKDGKVEYMGHRVPISGTLARSIINQLDFNNPTLRQLFPEELFNTPGFKELIDKLKS